MLLLVAVAMMERRQRAKWRYFRGLQGTRPDGAACLEFAIEALNHGQ